VRADLQLTVFLAGVAEITHVMHPVNVVQGEMGRDSVLRGGCGGIMCE
jgi:hypothetical protein